MYRKNNNTKKTTREILFIILFLPKPEMYRKNNREIQGGQSPDIMVRLESIKKTLKKLYT